MGRLVIFWRATRGARRVSRRSSKAICPPIHRVTRSRTSCTEARRSSSARPLLGGGAINGQCTTANYYSSSACHSSGWQHDQIRGFCDVGKRSISGGHWALNQGLSNKSAGFVGLSGKRARISINSAAKRGMYEASPMPYSVKLPGVVAQPGGVCLKTCVREAL